MPAMRFILLVLCLQLVETQVVVAVSPGSKIGEVAARSGLSVKTIRFYCDEGLIRPIARTAGRYRLFDSSVELELALIRSLRGMDISLAEVKQFLEARRLGLCSCDSLKAKINSKMSEIQQKIQNLHLLEAEMTTILNNWQPCGGAK